MLGPLTHTDRDSKAPLRRGRESCASAACAGCLAVSVLLAWQPMLAQEALRTSMAGEAAAEARRIQQENLAYTVKTGDFRLLATAGLAAEWNDNVNLTKDNPQDDFILRPTLGLNASYPVTQHNLLLLDVTFGYSKYFNHDELSAWYLRSGSELSFDIYVKDFWINLHDRFTLEQDSAREAAIANTGTYGNFLNTIGASGTWDLQDVTLSLGYDHQNYISTSSQYDYLDRASEMIVPRVGLKVHPRLTIGAEGSVSFTAYDQKILNNNIAYSGGIYGDWRPGNYFSLRPRFGYTFYDFQQTSQVVQAKDLDAWYLDLTVSHQATESISYSLSAGHELRLGIRSDLIDDWYVRPNLTWSVLKRLSVQSGLFYEHGKEATPSIAGYTGEAYDWFGGSIGLIYSILKNATISLNYRLTLRASNVPSSEYRQNLVGLQVAYTPK